MADPVCAGFWPCAFQFQTLAAGLIGTAAALVTASVIYIAARMPVKAEQRRQREREARRLRLRSLEVSGELTTLGKRTTQGKGTVKVYKASNGALSDEARQKMMLRLPEALLDWEFTSLLPEGLARECVELAGMVADHNFDMDRARGAFGDDNFGASVVNRLDAIGKLAGRLSQAFVGLAQRQS